MKYQYAVIIGRFQIFHNGHLALLKKAQSLADKVIVLVGSAGNPRSVDNPFTYNERTGMIFNATEEDNITCAPLYDCHSDQEWIIQVNNTLQGIGVDLTNKKDNCIVGHKKDDTSWYLDMFPNMYYEECENANNIHATHLRSLLFSGNLNKPIFKNKIPPKVHLTIASINSNVGDFEILKYEYKFINDYDSSNFPRIEHTVDSVVVQSGHVLMIKRRDFPGRGLWALPGGYLNPQERLLQGAVRELKEETCIDVPEKTLYANLYSEQPETFDHPRRDSRGRVITSAFLFALPDIGKLTKVKGADDAEKAEWIPINKIRSHQVPLYADHSLIIDKMLSKL